MPLARSGSATLQWHGTTSLYLLIAVLLTTLPAPTSLYCHAAGDIPRHHPPPPPQHHHHQQQQQQQRSPLHLLNPWVSACDLATPAEAPDLQGTCSTVMSDAELVTTYPNNTINNNNNNKYNNNKNTNNLHQSNNVSSVDPRQRGPGPPLGQDTYSCPPGCPGGDAKSSGVAASRRRPPGEAAQCLYYLNESHRDALCGRKTSSSSGGVGGGRGKTLHMTDKVQMLRSLRLRHCCEHSAAGALGEAAWEAVSAGGDACRLYLGALIELDQLAARVTCEFNEILVRYDCGQAYSVKYACEDCKESYRQWVCSSLVPHFARNASKQSDDDDDDDDGGDVGRLHRIRPCRDVCQQVEQRCPYFLPGDRAPSYPTQYAGEPTFLCLDPNIPETGEQLTRSSYGDAQCCYTVCGAAGICPHRGCARPNNHTYAAACPAQAQLNAPPSGGATSDTYQRSACSVPANQVQLTQRAVTSGTSKLSIANCCWIPKLLQFYVVLKDVILNSLLRILFYLVNGPQRIYVFGYT